MKKLILILTMTLCFLPLWGIENGSDQWMGEMTRELNGILDRDRISLVTRQMINELVDEELMGQSPSDAARLMAKMALNMDRQIRQGVMRRRVIRETIRNRDLYREEKPLFSDKGSRKGAPGSSRYSESRGNGNSDRGNQESPKKGFQMGQKK